MKYIIAFLAALWTRAAMAAAAPHTLDMTTVLHGLDGKPLKNTAQATAADKDCAKCGDLTLGDIVANVMCGPSPKEPNLTGDQKWSRCAHAMQWRAEKAAVLTPEEVVVVKRLIGDSAWPIIVMQVYPLLDPNTPLPKVQ